VERRWQFRTAVWMFWCKFQPFHWKVLGVGNKVRPMRGGQLSNSRKLEKRSEEN